MQKFITIFISDFEFSSLIVRAAGVGLVKWGCGQHSNLQDEDGGCKGDQPGPPHPGLGDQVLGDWADLETFASTIEET